MRVNHVQNRQRRDLANSLAQLITHFNATARINHRHAKTPNHKAGITNIAFVTIVNIHVNAMMHVYAVAHIFNRKIMMRSFLFNWQAGTAHQRQNAKHMTKHNH